jgi:hypothetical protein
LLFLNLKSLTFGPLPHLLESRNANILWKVAQWQNYAEDNN